MDYKKSERKNRPSKNEKRRQRDKLIKDIKSFEKSLVDKIFLIIDKEVNKRD